MEPLETHSEQLCWGLPVAVPCPFGLSLQFLSLLKPPDECTGPACSGDRTLADLQNWPGPCIARLGVGGWGDGCI